MEANIKLGFTLIILSETVPAKLNKLIVDHKAVRINKTKKHQYFKFEDVTPDVRTDASNFDFTLVTSTSELLRGGNPQEVVVHWDWKTGEPTTGHIFRFVGVGRRECVTIHFDSMKLSTESQTHMTQDEAILYYKALSHGLTLLRIKEDICFQPPIQR